MTSKVGYGSIFSMEKCIDYIQASVLPFPDHAERVDRAAL